MKENCQKTKWALMASSILSEPLVFFYALLVPIFIKELHATGLQIAILTTLHPVVTFLSLYFSSFAAKDPKTIKSFLIFGGILSRVLWFFIPFATNNWLIIVIAALYILFSKSTVPLWSELLRLNLEENQRHHWFSIASTMAYAVALVLTITIGQLMSQNGAIWKNVFILSALIGLFSVFFQAHIPIKQLKINHKAKFNLLTPWKEIAHVLRTDKSFLRFQMRFMLFGIAAMMLHPVMNLYFISVLKLTYLQIGFLISFCKGIGSVLSSRYWGKLLNRVKMDRFSSIIFIIFGCMILLACLAPLHIAFLYIAYLIRGSAQAGVHLVWNLSGPYYSGKKNSATYSGINLIMVGVRGCFAPSLGTSLAMLFGILPVLLMASLLCFISPMLFRKSEIRTLQENENVA